MNKEKTSSKPVVKDGNSYEEYVERWESYEEKVKWVPHLFGGENHDNDDVADDADAANAGLKVSHKRNWIELICTRATPSNQKVQIFAVSTTVGSVGKQDRLQEK